MNSGTISAGLCALSLGMASASCGGSQTTTELAAAPSSPPAADAGPPAVRKERPIAKSPMEAQSLIQVTIDEQMTALWRCVKDYRSRVNDPHREVLVDIGIDQEGILMGVTTATPKKGELEPALKQCLFVALHGQPFPRSHAGVISVRESFQDLSVSP